MAAIPIATPAIAPCNSPSVAAPAVPCPCEIVPKDRPLDNGWEIPVLFMSHGPIIVPEIPVPTTNAAVKAGSPPIIFAVSIATGTVTNFTLMEARIV